jgi:putative polyhydroxyalkanoate system protein
LFECYGRSRHASRRRLKAAAKTSRRRDDDQSESQRGVFRLTVHRKARDSRTRILWVAHKRWERPVATISIAKKHRLSHKKAKDAAEEIARDLKSRFALDYVWNGDRIDFERPGVSGSMHVRKDQIQLDVSLSFLLTPIKPSIEREIHAQLERLLGDKPKSAKA